MFSLRHHLPDAVDAWVYLADKNIVGRYELLGGSDSGTQLRLRLARGESRNAVEFKAFIWELRGI